MREILILLLCLGLSGCIPLLIGAGVGAGVGVGVASSRKSISQTTAVNRANLLKLSLGITKDEAISIMGTKPMNAFYTELSGKRKITRGVIVNNPYRSETLKGKNKTLEVVYYATDVKDDDGAITDDELTPLVFDEGKLIGWGWSFLQNNVKKYEIRMR